MDDRLKWQGLGMRQLKLEKKFAVLERELAELDAEARQCFNDSEVSTVEVELDSVNCSLSLTNNGHLKVEALQPDQPVEEPPTQGQIDYLEGLRWPKLPKTKFEAMKILSELAKVRPGVDQTSIPVTASQEYLLRYYAFWSVPPPPQNYAEAYKRISRLLSKKKPSDAQIIMARGLGHYAEMQNAAVAHDIIAWLRERIQM
ncbi:MAG: hypothetical protein ABSF90_15190 [Syntrophobacteraceae bacterium]|jgi:hypothetical protein